MMQLALEFESKTFGVSELTAYLKRTIKTDPILGGTLLVKGEVSNLKPSSRGHVYFTLKDDTASINAVMWASTASKSKFTLEEGMELIATGDLDLYAPQRKLFTGGQKNRACRFRRLTTRLRTAQGSIRRRRLI